MNYKSITFSSMNENKIIEFDLEKNMIHNEEEFILKTSVFVELIGYVNSKIVVFKNMDFPFQMDSILGDYFRKNVIDVMHNYGVNNIYYETKSMVQK